MKKKISSIILLLLSVLCLFTGCTAEELSSYLSLDETETSIAATDETKVSTTITSITTQENSTDLSSLAKKAEASVKKNKKYILPEEVAAYIHLYEELPENFITKKEAQSLGWESNKGNLQEVAPGMSIGGDYFGNYEEILPTNTKYHECDVNYTGGYRQAERLIYAKDGSIYYTNDHYATFTEIY